MLPSENLILQFLNFEDVFRNIIQISQEGENHPCGLLFFLSTPLDVKYILCNSTTCIFNNLLPFTSAFTQNKIQEVLNFAFMSYSVVYYFYIIHCKRTECKNFRIFSSSADLLPSLVFQLQQIVVLQFIKAAHFLINVRWRDNSFINTLPCPKSLSQPKFCFYPFVRPAFLQFS